MLRKLIVIMGLFSLLFGSCSERSNAPTAAAASKFRAGQVWKFRTPSDQPNARLTILKVEDGGELGTIVHVALSGVSYGKGQSTVQHLPFAESAIEQSVTTLESESGPIPDFAEGYGLWREAFDAGKGGVFTISVAEAFDLVTNVSRSP